MKDKHTILLVSGGEPDWKALEEAVKEADEIIALDRGLDYLKEIGIVPDLLLGDLDSTHLNPASFPKGMEIKRFPKEKDATDTQLGIEEAIARGAERILMLGATGRRLDHFLGNLDALLPATEYGVEAIMIDAYNRIRMFSKSFSIKKSSTYVSLIPYTDRVTGVTLRGFRYEVTDRTFVKGNTLGISNEITADEAYVHFEEGIFLVIESND